MADYGALIRDEVYSRRARQAAPRLAPAGPPPPAIACAKQQVACIAVSEAIFLRLTNTHRAHRDNVSHLTMSVIAAAPTLPMAGAAPPGPLPRLPRPRPPKGGKPHRNALSRSLLLPLPLSCNSVSPSPSLEHISGVGGALSLSLSLSLSPRPSRWVPVVSASLSRSLCSSPRPLRSALIGRSGWRPPGFVLRGLILSRGKVVVVENICSTV
jgi:hypothetical protein